MLRMKMVKEVFQNDLSDFILIEKVDFNEKDQLAKTMFDAYKYSPDYENDTVDDFKMEIDNLKEGLYGDIIEDACLCIRYQGQIVSAIFLCDFRGEATVTYCCTQRAYQGGGLAEALIKKAENELYKKGYKEFYTYLTLTNKDAFALFDSLGFSEIEI